MQSIDSIETYAYGTIRDLASEEEEIKCINIIKRYKKRLTLMIQNNNPNWPQIPDHPDTEY